MTQDYMQYPNLRKHMDRLYVRIDKLETEVARLKDRIGEEDKWRDNGIYAYPVQEEERECNCRELAPYYLSWVCPEHGYRQECKPLAKFGEH